ncbi:MAG: LPS assembly lipoprotein LptE [Gemmatimonadales bacterium]
MRPTSGVLALASALLSALALGGCLYGFAGGGLPPNVKTVAILPFENLTPEPTLTRDIQDAVRDAMEGRLGLRQAGEASADAVVRGTISRYEPDLPVAYQGTTDTDVQVTQRLVQITVAVEIVDQRTGKTLWERSSLTLDGNYDPGQELDGRRRAYERLVTNIVEGAQSQW